jgi:ATP-binding cassette, subfamily B, multidrug efflux pump
MALAVRHAAAARPGALRMLLHLLRRSLRPYRRTIALVMALLLVQTVANLFLPSLNADIINNGVAKGDLHYIWVTGSIMLALTLGLALAHLIR